jgi:putative ABC transport system substrate-binding protein
MRRRDFITLLGGAAAWPLAARAQQPALPVVGYLDTGRTPEASAGNVVAFRKGLSEAGFFEGRNVAIEYRWGENNDPRAVRDLVDDLVRRRVSVIASVGSLQGTLAAKAATTTIPIVFRTASDPVQDGIVASFNRPEANITGVYTIGAKLDSKRLGLLRELVPRAERFGALISPTLSPESITADLTAAAAAVGRALDVFAPSTSQEIDAVFASIVQKRIDALLFSPSILIDNRRFQIITLVAYDRLPAIYTSRYFVEGGGLMSYGPSRTYAFGQAGIYTGSILKGAKPADLPVVQSTKFEFVLNLQTARALGIEVPPGLLAIADEVIE